MLNLRRGKPIAFIDGGPLDGEFLHLATDDELLKSCGCERCNRKQCLKQECCLLCCIKVKQFMGKEMELKEGHIKPMLDPTARTVAYVAGPSGSGKSYYSAGCIARLQRMTGLPIYIFSRSDPKDDPTLKNLKYTNIEINEELLKDPIDITTEFKKGAIVLFDDVTTIQDDKLKKYIEKLMSDILEVGRKYLIYIIVTSHLIIGNEKKFSRIILNEMHQLTIFPKSGGAQQIGYALKTYFGLGKKQIEQILKLPSRWATVTKSYPMMCIHENGAMIL